MLKKYVFIARDFLIRVRIFYLKKCFGMNISMRAKMSFSCNLDKTHGQGIFIDDGAFLARGCTVLAHDFTRSLYADTRVGKNTFIGVNAIIMPGVTIGDGSIVAAGSVVRDHVPPGCLVAGVPATIKKKGIRTREYGKLEK